MNLKEVENIYFIGIGGVGMSAIARYFHTNGKRIAGYDKTSTKITEELQSLGIEIHFEDAIGSIPSEFKDQQSTLIVFTPAIPDSHIELNFFLENAFIVIKRAEILGLITKNSFCFAVAGTHGKTTTSCILGHILQPYQVTSFLGGISENYHSNLILGRDEVSVVEADEYDRSFLKLYPNIACITSTDADHLDIYGEHFQLQKSFEEFAGLVTNQLFVAKGVAIKGTTYAVEQSADYEIQKVHIANGSYFFDIKTPSKIVKDVEFSLPGKHNLMNVLAAFAMAETYEIATDKIKASLKSFKGVERRFSYRIKSDNLVLIDDYAHHPTEISSVYQTIKEMYPEEKNMVIFQPHLFSRTQDFIKEFATILELFDEIRVLDIYPARELPIEGVTSQWLLSNMQHQNKKLVRASDLVKEIQNSDAKVVTMLGAGDIGKMIDDVVKELNTMEKV